MRPGVLLWLVTHVVIAVAGDHPDYLNSAVVIGGFMSHLFYTVALALIVRRRLGA